MKKTVLSYFKILLTASLLLSYLPVAQAETRLLDRIVAIVEDGIILQSEIDERVAAVKANIERSGGEVPPDSKMRREILDLLIVENLQLQMAERAGVRISDAQLNASMSRIAAQNGLNLNQFRQALEESGASYAGAREQIRRDMILQQVQQGNVNPRIQVTEQEVTKFMTTNKGKTTTAPEYRIGHILVPVSSDAGASAQRYAKQVAGKLVDRVRGGEGMQESAQSENLAAQDLGWRKEPDIPSIFTNVVVDLVDGQTPEPIQSASGYHVIKLLDSRGRREVIQQTRASHILMKTSALENDADIEATLAELRSRAQRGEAFAKLAREYSKDIGSAQEGGDLGWVSPGQLVPNFEKVMGATREGDISAPFQSRYGWHILKVDERRKKDVTEELKRRIARNTIHQKKFQEESEIWLRKLRDEAYVDIKI